MTCLHCGATTSNGLALCELCQRKGQTMLEYLPVYFRNLARWNRPNRPNGSLGSQGSWVLRQGDTGDANRIGRALDDAGNMLATWAKSLNEDRDIPILTSDGEVAQVEILCTWFSALLTTISTLEWADQFLGDLDHHERRLRVLTEEVAPGWYAGGCKQCGLPTHVVPGLTWVTCRYLVTETDGEGKRFIRDIGCGTTTYARDHLDIVLTEARDWIAQPARLAEAIVALVDTEQSVGRLRKRICKWGDRDRITAIDRLGYQRELDYAGEKYAPKRYRLGDVIDLLFVEGATRLDATENASAS